MLLSITMMAASYTVRKYSYFLQYYGIVWMEGLIEVIKIRSLDWTGKGIHN